MSTVSTMNEIFPGDGFHPMGPYGLGMRVPMIVISPWSKGGWVNSQVFDHTSLIRFIETRFGGGPLTETNITPWRRAVTGDLTSAFDFDKPNGPQKFSLPSTDAFKPPAYDVFYDNFDVVPPADQAVPKQEPGIRPARALPYSLNAHGALQDSDGSFHIDFENTGSAAAVFQVRSGSDAHIPRTYTVEPGKSLSDSWDLGSIGIADCDLSVYGPNGFFRSFKGSVAGLRNAHLDVTATYDEAKNTITLAIANGAPQSAKITVRDNYTGKSIDLKIKSGGTGSNDWSLTRLSGWYDLVITVADDSSIEFHFAGHVENGKDSISDPALGR